MTIIPEPELSLFTIIFGVFILFLVVQFIYVTFIHAKFAFYKEDQSLSDQPLVHVSIIIAARN